MKQIMVTLMGMMFFLSVNAAEQAVEGAVTMVSYEQSWLDVQGTLALKNNTKDTLRAVSFMISYLDMADNEQDYEEFYREVNIAPGMTRKVDIPAYEHDRLYQYYKSKAVNNYPKFKIRFHLQGYKTISKGTEQSFGKIENEEIKDDIFAENTDSPHTGEMIFVVFLILCFVIGLYIMVAVMAQSRNRSVIGWIFLSLVGTPLLAILILWTIGERDEYRYR